MPILDVSLRVRGPAGAKNRKEHVIIRSVRGDVMKSTQYMFKNWLYVGYVEELGENSFFSGAISLVKISPVIRYQKYFEYFPYAHTHAQINEHTHTHTQTHTVDEI